MKLLAIETSTIACSAALLVDGTLRERYEIAPRRHADLLLPMIESLLGEAGLSARQLDAIAFGRGPGAFTGLRIAAAAAQGIAWGADLAVIPVSTLAALAQGAFAEGKGRRILTAMDARMQEVYWAAYEADDDALRLCGDETVRAPETVPVPGGGQWLGVGDGWSAHAAALGTRTIGVLAGTEAGRYPRARDIATLAARSFRQSGGMSATEALPVYLRDQVAVKPPARPGKS